MIFFFIDISNVTNQQLSYLPTYSYMDICISVHVLWLHLAKAMNVKLNTAVNTGRSICSFQHLAELPK